MGWPSYIPGKSTLLLFKAARVRLMATSENVGSLPNKRIASATEVANANRGHLNDRRTL
jgi:hypothetical protein